MRGDGRRYYYLWLQPHTENASQEFLPCRIEDTQGLGLPHVTLFDFIGPTLYPVIQSPGRICCVVQ